MSTFEEAMAEEGQSLEETIVQIDGWMESNGFHNDHTRTRLKKLTEVADEKKRRVLFLAEFSRGKSELINSVIFGEDGQRMLPSSAGRTTRCTTEIQFEPLDLPSIRLIPTIASTEIQKQPISLLKENPDIWKQVLFSSTDKNAVSNALMKITETESVSVDVAFELGYLHSTDEEELAKLDVTNGELEIPKWRHAIINFPHPILQEGLSIIDTPGLNAVGIEPELTIRMVDSANAIVFILSADTGLTQSDLMVWKEHIEHGTADNVLVVLNKVDMLWDELKTKPEIEAEINKQITEVSRILGIKRNRIFALSAQKSLLARNRNDSRLLTQSGILPFEKALGETISYSDIKGKVNIIRKELDPTLNIIERVLTQRSKSTVDQIREIELNKNKQNNLSDNAIEKVKLDIAKHQKINDQLSEVKSGLALSFQDFISKLDIYFLDRLIARYRLEISNQLTTPGLQREMNDFQTVAVDRFNNALKIISKLEEEIVTFYETVQAEFQTSGLRPRKIHPDVYLKSLKNFQEKHMKYASGLSLVMTEQNTLRDRYHASVMVKMRRLYTQTKEEVDLWCRTVLTPLELEVKEKESQLKKRLISLQRMKQKGSNMNEELKVLESRLNLFNHRLNSLKYYIKKLDYFAARKPEVETSDNVVDLHTRSMAN